MLLLYPVTVSFVFVDCYHARIQGLGRNPVSAPDYGELNHNNLCNIVFQGCFLSSNPFDEVFPLCTRTNELIQEVFSNPDVVMGKLVQNIYLTKIQVSITLWVEP